MRWQWTEVISIKFRGRGKTYYFDPAGVTARTGDTLVVETSKGMELGECVKGNHMVGDGDCVQPLRPVVRRATPDDLLRRAIIQALMCHFELSIESIEIAHLVDFKTYFEAELADLREMEKGGLLQIDDQWITVLPAGRMLVRAIAMVFDRYLRSDRERTRYSKVI